MDINLIGQRIKEARERKNISADELAAEVGVHKATIHRYENADFKSMKLPIIESIAKILEVSPAWIIGKTDNPTPEVYPIPDRDWREISKIIDTTLDLLRQEGLTLDGKPASAESVQTIIDSLTVSGPLNGETKPLKMISGLLRES